MENLSIKEKAKRFDEVIENFDVILNLNTVKESGTIFADDVRKILPELVESWDERIRKELIAIYSVGARGNMKTGDIPDKDIVAWLEKQGEQKPQGKTALEAINEEKVDNANKVGPKFKVGDWIVSKKDSTVHKVKAAVENISNGKYWYDLTDGGFIPTSHESDYRLLSINDSKIEVKKIDKLTEEYNITGIGSKHAQGKLGEMIKKIKPTNSIWHDNKCIPDKDDKEILIEYNLNNSTRPNHLFHDVAPYDSDSKMFHCYSMHLKLEEIIRWAYMDDILQVVNR